MKDSIRCLLHNVNDIFVAVYLVYLFFSNKKIEISFYFVYNLANILDHCHPPPQ